MEGQEKIFPSLLRQFRLQSGLSQGDIGDALGKKRVTISTWEMGTREPSLGDLARLGEILGCGVERLLGISSEGPPPMRAWVSELIPDLEALDKHGQEAVKALVAGLKAKRQ